MFTPRQLCAFAALFLSASPALPQTAPAPAPAGANAAVAEPVSEANRTAIRDVVEGFFRSLSARDYAGTLGAWDDVSPRKKGFAAPFIGSFLNATRQSRASDLQFGSWQKRPGGAVAVAVRVKWDWVESESERATGEVETIAMLLKRNESGWQMQNWDWDTLENARKESARETVRGVHLKRILIGWHPDHTLRVGDEELQQIDGAIAAAGKLGAGDREAEIAWGKRLKARLLDAHEFTRFNESGPLLLQVVENFQKLPLQVLEAGKDAPVTEKPRILALSQRMTREEGRTCRLLGAHLLVMQESDEAKQWIDRALKIAAETRDGMGAIDALCTQAEWLRWRGQLEAASKVLERAGTIAQNGSEGALQSETLSRISRLAGDVALLRGDYAGATLFLRAALESARQSRLVAPQMEALLGRSHLETATGRLAAARASQREALQLSLKERNGQPVEAILGAYSDLIDSHVREFVQRGTDLTRTGGFALAEATLEYMTQAVKLRKATVYSSLAGVRWHARIARSAGLATSVFGASVMNHPDPQVVFQAKMLGVETAVMLERLLDLEKTLGDAAGQARTLNVIALNRLSTALGNYGLEKALGTFREALILATATGQTLEQFTARNGTGEALRRQKKWAEAEVEFRAAIALAETVRESSRESTLQTGTLQTLIAPYNGLIECMVGRKAPAETLLAAIETARARALIDVLRGGRANVVKGLSAPQIARERALLEAESALQVSLQERDADPKTTPLLKARLSLARAETDEFRRALFLKTPVLAAQRAAFAPANLKTIQETLFEGQTRRAIALFHVGETQTQLLVLTPGNGAAQLEVHALPIGRAQLAIKVREMRTAATRPSNVADDFSELRALLLGPLENRIKALDELILVPDGPLATLPFAAFNDEDGGMLVQQVALRYAPGVTALVEMSRAPRTGAASVPWLGLARGDFADMGLKPLPGALAEVSAIAPLFQNGASAQGDRATKAFARENLPRARLIHLATHGLLNEVTPLYSAIALAPDAQDPDGRLYARDLMEMDLNADLVVLSACETALGQEVRGEGVLGLTWALFVAGAPTSLVTQWSVDDSATSALMPIFYRELQTGKAPALALRAAQLELLKDRKTRHPAYWAPFTVVGAGS